MNAPTTVFVAKCYWPGVTERHLRDAAERAAAGYLGSIVIADDELVLALFAAPSPAAARSMSERAGMPCERVMESSWMPAPTNPRRGGACAT
jgi:hypothetical protein